MERELEEQEGRQEEEKVVSVADIWVKALCPLVSFLPELRSFVRVFFGVIYSAFSMSTLHDPSVTHNLTTYTQKSTATVHYN